MTHKIALITGASRGLGRNAALKLAARGVDLILTWRSGQAEAEEVCQQARAMGVQAAALQLDAGDIARFAEFVAQVKTLLHAQWGREQFDYLLNNAGVGIHASFADTTEEQFDELVNVHLKGPFFLTQHLLPLIADGGRILNVSSGLTRFSFPGLAAYASMKGGIEVLTKHMAKELGPRRITVNVIAPGAIATDFGGGVTRDNPQVNAAIAAQTALGRAGLPDDIGDAMSLLLSDEAGWINGQRIEVSGGMVL